MDQVHYVSSKGSYFILIMMIGVSQIFKRRASKLHLQITFTYKETGNSHKV